MEVKIGADELFVSFVEGNLNGMTIHFVGDRWTGNVLALYSDSGKVIAPVERELTAAEFKYVKKSVLTFVKANHKEKGDRKIKFIQ